MRVRTTTKFKDLKAKKLRKLDEEFECTEERFEEIKKYVEPVQEEPTQDEPDATAHEPESVQEESPKKATKAKKGSK